jgi:hypothetical protein
MFKFQLFAAAGGVGLVLIASAFTAYDKSANYTQVTGEVFRVDRKCYLEGKERGVVTKTTTTTEEYPCPEMEDALANHPKYQGFEIHRHTNISVSFKSPVDNETHTKDLDQTTSGDTKPFKGAVLGDKIEILAHKTKADNARTL